MQSRIGACCTALLVIAMLALPGKVAAQHPTNLSYPYILIDLGTFGGPNSSIQGPTIPSLTNNGLAAGFADTPISDTDYPNTNPTLGPDPFIGHAFLWQHGVKTDLGAPPGNNSTVTDGVNVWGDVAGQAEDGITDPLGGFPEVHAVLWTHGRLIDLGTFGGYESVANGINDRRQVVGFAANTIPDPYNLVGTQTLAYLWQDGHMQNLGTLGGPDSFALYFNDRAQVTGVSFTSAISNTTTGVPTQDPFFWQDGHMTDLGTLGGTNGYPNGINSSGEVVGQSNLQGDQLYHPFLWEGQAMQDLGTLGGNYGTANWINDAGAVAGWATTSGDLATHAVLWQHGVMSDLGLLAGDTYSVANAVNLRGQVVGGSGTCGSTSCTQQGFLWQHGAMTDLQSLVAPSDLQVSNPLDINDRGEIAGDALLPNGDQHGFLMIPADVAASEGITSNAPAPGTTAPAITVQRNPVACLRGPAWLRRPVQTYRPRIC